MPAVCQLQNSTVCIAVCRLTVAVNKHRGIRRERLVDESARLWKQCDEVLDLGQCELSSDSKTAHCRMLYPPLTSLCATSSVKYLNSVGKRGKIWRASGPCRTHTL
jgi:hypothetical protein